MPLPHKHWPAALCLAGAKDAMAEEICLQDPGAYSFTLLSIVILALIFWRQVMYSMLVHRWVSRSLESLSNSHKDFGIRRAASRSHPLQTPRPPRFFIHPPWSPRWPREGVGSSWQPLCQPARYLHSSARVWRVNGIEVKALSLCQALWVPSRVPPRLPHAS